MASDDFGRGYTEGERRARISLLQFALNAFSGSDAASRGDRAGWIIERQETIAALRELCAKFGDNDWPDELMLSDVIEKHLAKHLYLAEK